MTLNSLTVSATLFFLAVVPVLPAAAQTADATPKTIAVIGTGSVGGALGPEFAALGHSVVYGSRDPSRDDVRALVARTGNGATATTPAAAADDADIVVLAVPGMVVGDVESGLGDLSGKILIDPTNPLVRGDDGLFRMGVDSSNGEIIQANAPGAFVVKAFNTLNWSTMVDPESAGGPVSIPLAGDSAAAKRTVAALVEELGLEAIDVGGIHHARHVEGMLILWINNRYVDGQAFEFHLRKVDVD